MKTTEQNIKVYTPSKNVRVKVVNKPIIEDDVRTGYKRNVTIFINEGEAEDRIDFKADDDISKYIETVDFEDPQTALDLKANK